MRRTLSLLIAGALVSLALPVVLSPGSADAADYAAQSVTPSDFGLISGESTVHVVNGVNAGNPVYGGELTPTDSSGFPDSDLDGSATTPDGRTILYASGGGNVSVCLNVQSGNPDCF